MGYNTVEMGRLEIGFQSFGTCVQNGWIRNGLRSPSQLGLDFYLSYLYVQENYKSCGHKLTKDSCNTYKIMYYTRVDWLCALCAFSQLHRFFLHDGLLFYALPKAVFLLSQFSTPG